MQVCSFAAGGKVNKGKKGAHMGIAQNIKINDIGIKHPLYQNKINNFNTPAFNFDEVSEIPENSEILASNNVNDVMGLSITYKNSTVWGLQYHPDYGFDQTINLTKLRKGKLISNNYISNEDDFTKHIFLIQEEEKKLKFENRTQEIKNWLNFIKEI